MNRIPSGTRSTRWRAAEMVWSAFSDVTCGKVPGGNRRDCLPSTGRERVSRRKAEWRDCRHHRAAVLAEIELEIFLAVVDRDLLARLDALARPEDHAAAVQLGLGVRLAGMIDVTGKVAPGRSVDGPARIELEQVFVGAAAVEIGGAFIGDEA